jgi:hypothetical protein
MATEHWHTLGILQLESPIKSHGSIYTPNLWVHQRVEAPLGRAREPQGEGHHQHRQRGVNERKAGLLLRRAAQHLVAPTTLSSPAHNSENNPTPAAQPGSAPPLAEERQSSELDAIVQLSEAGICLL